MNGQTLILNSQRAREQAKRLVSIAPHGAVCNIQEARRTNEQNAKFWAMLSDISRAKPDGRVHTTEQWKAIFLSACDHKPAFLPSLEGDDFICTGYRSSRLTKSEMSELIECMMEFGARKGVEWSEPVDEAEAA